MRTLHIALRISEQDRSVQFYSAIGYVVIGEVAQTPLGRLTVLQLPDDEFGSLELVHNPDLGEVVPGEGFSHLVVQTDSIRATLDALGEAGFRTGVPESPGGADGPVVAWIIDPDGYRIELTQWPAGHPAGFTRADFTQ